MTNLTIEAAFNNLAFFQEHHFPEQELCYLLAHQEEATPLLLQEVDDAISRHEQVPTDYMLHLYALYVLAHFRCEELFPKLIALLKLPGDAQSNLVGSDCITGYGLPNIIASTFNGDFSLLTVVIEDQAAYDYARTCALSSITPLVLLGKLKRETAIHYLTELTQTKLDNKQWSLWTALVEITMDLYLEELKPVMIEAFSKGIVDGYCTQEELINHFDAREEKKKWHDERMERSYHFIDAINDMKWWACFQSKATLKKRSDALTRNLARSMQHKRLTDSTYQHAPVVREKKIGRNESCHCGSGKKYKKCCLLAHQAQ